MHANWEKFNHVREFKNILLKYFAEIIRQFEIKVTFDFSAQLSKACRQVKNILSKVPWGKFEIKPRLQIYEIKERSFSRLYQKCATLERDFVITSAFFIEINISFLFLAYQRL